MLLGIGKEILLLIRAVDTNLYKKNSSKASLNFKSNFHSNPNASKAVSDANLSGNISKALEVLGDKKLELIIHNGSAPSLEGKDVGVGSLYSESSRQLLIPFLKKYGFSAIQVDPEGMRQKGSASPYTSNSFVYNPLIIDLEDLTKPENGALLDSDVYNSIVNLNPARGRDLGDYGHAYDSYGIALSNAWINFKEKSSNPDSISNPTEKSAIKNLMNEYDRYYAQNIDMLEPYAIYSVLSNKYGNDYYANWPYEMQNLYNPKNDRLINSIKAQYQDDIDKFIFTDLLAKKAREEGIAAYNAAGIKTIGDNPVGFSHQEVWAHKDAFLKDYKIGCPPDQKWGFAAFNPDKLFNHDGSLGSFGQLLYDKCKKLAQDNQGGIRLDHIVGLIDPFVYVNEPWDQSAGRLLSSPNIHNLRRYAIPTKQGDSTKRFSAILEKIVIPACEEGGLTKADIVCENLGPMPDHARNVFYSLGLGGMTMTRYDNGTSARPVDTVMYGSHDTEPLVTYTNDLYGAHGQDAFNHALWPAVENSLPRNASHNTKQAKFDKYRFDTNRHKPEENKYAFRQFKFTELFTSPAQRVQIFWTDLLGMDKRYNTPQTVGPQNWTLRLSSDFDKNFDPSMLIQSISDALKAQDAKTVRENQNLINSLDASARQARQEHGNRFNIVG